MIDWMPAHSQEFFGFRNNVDFNPNSSTSNGFFFYLDLGPKSNRSSGGVR